MFLELEHEISQGLAKGKIIEVFGSWEPSAMAIEICLKVLRAASPRALIHVQFIGINTVTSLSSRLLEECHPRARTRDIKFCQIFNFLFSQRCHCTRLCAYLFLLLLFPVPCVSAIIRYYCTGKWNVNSTSISLHQLQLPLSSSVWFCSVVSPRRRLAASPPYFEVRLHDLEWNYRPTWAVHCARMTHPSMYLALHFGAKSRAPAAGVNARPPSNRLIDQIV